MESFIRINLLFFSKSRSKNRIKAQPTTAKVKHFYHKGRKRLIRFSLLSTNIALLAMVVFFVTKTPAETNTLSQNSISPIVNADTITGPLDQVSSADIAVHVARTAGLPESDSVVNHADSVSATEATSSADINVVAKPQVVSEALPSKRDIHTYTVESGDTISSIATKFGVSSENIRGSNGLNGNNVSVGKQLLIPPTGSKGLVYKVRAGDTPDSLAQKFSSNKDAIIRFNDAEIDGLKVGENILIPDGVIRAPVAAPSYNYYAGFAWGGSRPVYNANGYSYGWCTWHAANRRSEVGRPIPSNLGNAISWYSVARNNGIILNRERSKKLITENNDFYLHYQVNVLLCKFLT